MTDQNRKRFPGSIEDYDQVSGPVTITYHPNIASKRDIYIFGDIHLENSGLCQMVFDNRPIEIVDFFDKIFHNSDKRLDFFLEIPVITLNKSISTPPLSIPSPPIPQEGPMVRLRERFEDCFSGTLMSGCERRYPNTMFHSMDIRQKMNGRRNNGKLTLFTQYSQILSSIVSDCHSQVNGLTKLISAEKEQIPHETKMEMLKKTSQLLLLFNNNELIKIMKDYVRIPHRDINFNVNGNFEYYEQVEYPGVNQIKDRINELSYDSKKKIMDFFDKRSLMILKSYKDIQEGIEKNFKNIMENLEKNKQIEKKENVFMKLCNLIKLKSLIMFNIDGLFFDISNLAKVLKLLDEKYDTTPGEIWIYAGEGHSEVFRDFIINHLGNKDYYKSASITERCQDIKEIKTQSQKRKTK